jgi:hypothetical protein
MNGEREKGEERETYINIDYMFFGDRIPRFRVSGVESSFSREIV